MQILPGAIGADYVKLTPEIKDWILKNKVSFVCRYCVPLETTKIGKVITDEEIAWLFDHNIAILLNWEINHLDGDRGAAGGTRAGEWLKAKAAELGCPESVPLFCSIDTDTWSGNSAKAEDYVRAFAAAISPHRVGIYGDSDIAHLTRDLDPVFWRANARGWGAVKPNQTVHVQQQKAQYPPGIDPNVCEAEFAGWLEVEELPPPPPPAPKPTDKTDTEKIMLALPIITTGAVGEHVESVQSLLSARGFKTKPDGVFGPVTTKQVKSFQTARRLTVDGVVGRKETWPALLLV